MLVQKQKGAVCSICWRYKVIMKLKTVALTVFLLSSCAGLTGNMDALENDVSILKGQVASLNLRLQETNTKLTKLESHEATVASNTVNALRDSQSDLNTKFTKLTQEVKQLNRRIDESKYNTNLSRKESTTERDILKAQISTLETMIKELQMSVANPDTTYKPTVASKSRENSAPSSVSQNKQQSKEEPAVVPPLPVVSSLESSTSSSTPAVTTPAATTPAAATTAAATTAATTTTTTTPATPNTVTDKKSGKALYESALKDYEGGFYKASRDKLYKIVKDEPAGALAEASNFLIADTYYKEGSYEDAIIQYEEMLKKYPKSKTIPEALLKQGLSFVALGGEQNIDTAKLIFKQLYTKYPKSKEAAQAKEKYETFSKGKKKNSE